MSDAVTVRCEKKCGGIVAVIDGDVASWSTRTSPRHRQRKSTRVEFTHSLLDANTAAIAAANPPQCRTCQAQYDLDAVVRVAGWSLRTGRRAVMQPQRLPDTV